MHHYRGLGISCFKLLVSVTLVHGVAKNALSPQGISYTLHYFVQRYLSIVLICTSLCDLMTLKENFCKLKCKMGTLLLSLPLTLFFPLSPSNLKFPSAGSYSGLNHHYKVIKLQKLFHSQIFFIPSQLVKRREQVY